MPEPDYNESLFNFEHDLMSQLEIEGRMVLVETYAGKRIYYAYVADESTSKDRATKVLSGYGHLTEANFRGGADPDWKFYDRYIEKIQIASDD
jgi:hypothetical protein